MPAGIGRGGAGYGMGTHSAVTACAGAFLLTAEMDNVNVFLAQLCQQTKMSSSKAPAVLWASF